MGYGPALPTARLGGEACGSRRRGSGGGATRLPVCGHNLSVDTPFPFFLTSRASPFLGETGARESQSGAGGGSWKTAWTAGLQLLNRTANPSLRRVKGGVGNVEVPLTGRLGGTPSL